MKKIIFAALVLIAVCVPESPRVVAQDPASEPTATADSTANVTTDQELALLRKDIRSIKKQLIAGDLTLTDSEAATESDEELIRS